ncbi:MAG: hypothetical protein DI620_00295 [Haemophilus parainfluenzae]|jgi:ppiC-type peptidyl-prolyl cis-trans isomerase|nr:MAG: hypothetical protein DI620_00295 [Haemophilus parainfluenzae]
MQVKQYLRMAILASFFSISQAANVQWVDKIAVIVNNDVITERDIQDISNQLKASASGKQLTGVNIREVATDNLISERLLKQAAENMQLTISDQEIDQQIRKVATANHLTVAQFLAEIKREGVGEQRLKQTMKENLLVQKLVTATAQDQAQVSDEEVAAFLQEKKLTPTEQNKEKVQQFILSMKEQQILQSIAQDLKKSAYIEFKKKPY